MKKNKYIVIAVVLIILASACIVSAKSGKQKGEEKRMEALMNIKERLIEKRGYDPSLWPKGFVEIFSDLGLLR